MNERELELEDKIAKLETENAELRKAERLLAGRTALALAGMVYSTWKHSISNHTAIISDLVKLIRDDINTHADIADINSRLDMLDQITSEVAKMSIVPSLSFEEETDVTDIISLIYKRIEQLKAKSRYSNVEIKLSIANKPVNVRISQEWFKRGLDLLIDNSVNAMASSKIKQIDIRVSTLKTDAIIEVTDTGHGISADIIPLLFIQQIPRKEGKKGSGLGLLMAQMIFRTYGGDLQLTQTSPQGTTFTISLPKVI